VTAAAGEEEGRSSSSSAALNTAAASLILPMYKPSLTFLIAPKTARQTLYRSPGQELMYSCPHLLQNLKKLSCPPPLFLPGILSILCGRSFYLCLSVCLSLPLLLSLMLLLLGLLLLLQSSSLVSDLVLSLSLPHRSLQLPELACYKFSATGLGFGVHVVVLIRGQRPSSKLSQCCRFAFPHT
jgi:hypothetical protein